MTEFVVDVGVTGRERVQLADHLAVSRAALTREVEVMDRCFFRLSADEARLETPVTLAFDAIVAAAGGDGPVRVRLPDLGKREAYCLSFALEASAGRAAKDWLDPSGLVGAAVWRIQQAVDRHLGVTGDPGERSYWRSPLPYAKRGRSRRSRLALTGGDAA